MVVLGGWAFCYERGTPVIPACVQVHPQPIRPAKRVADANAISRPPHLCQTARRPTLIPARHKIHLNVDGRLLCNGIPALNSIMTRPDLLGQSLSHTMFLFIGFIKSTPPQHRQLKTLISNSEQQVNDFAGELTL